MLSEIEQVLPSEIEKRSFEIITEELKEMGKILCPETELIVKRCIHTSADFELCGQSCFYRRCCGESKGCISAEVCDYHRYTVGKAGINKKRLAEYGSEVLCFMSDEDVAEMAKKNGTTRAVASMDKASALGREAIFAVGNAPTALVRLYELIKEGKINPELIIAVPVGFVNVVQSKELILSLEDTPSIVARGRKGGSNIAACICNALLYQM